MADKTVPDDANPVLPPVQEYEDEYIDALENLGDIAMDGKVMDNMEDIMNFNREAGVVEDDPNNASDAVVDETERSVSWTDVTNSNIITERRRRQPRKRKASEGYHFANSVEDMDRFLMVQTVHI